MRKKWRFLIFILIMFCAKMIGQPVRYAVFPAPPYMIIEETSDAAKDSLKVSGIDVEILTEIGRRTGIELEFVPAPWARCIELVKSGDADIISSVFKNSDRSVFLDYFEEPYLTELPIAFYSLSSSNITIKKYSDLYSLSLIGVLRNAKYFTQFDEDLALKKYEAKTQDLLYPMLLAKRIDVFAGYIPTENYFIKTKGYEDKIVRSEFSYSDPAFVYFAVSKKSKNWALIKKMETEFLNMLKNGKVAEIVEYYYVR